MCALVVSETRRITESLEKSVGWVPKGLERRMDEKTIFLMGILEDLNLVIDAYEVGGSYWKAHMERASLNQWKNPRRD